jgi:hypothetical protein
LRGKFAAGEVFGCIPHGRGAYRESDSFAMWAVHHGVTVSMTTVSMSSDPFIPVAIMSDLVGPRYGTFERSVKMTAVSIS